MALPRLKAKQESALQSTSKASKQAPRRNTKDAGKAASSANAGNAATAARRLAEEEELKYQLAREEEILSLLTVLNQPVMTPDLPATLQAVKAHLYARNYSAAFGHPVRAMHR